MDDVKRDSVVADKDEEDVTDETFFSSKDDSFLAVVDFLLTILFLEEFSDQSFFASAADSIKVILWSELSALVLGFVCLHAEMSQYKFSLFSASRFSNCFYVGSAHAKDGDLINEFGNSCQSANQIKKQFFNLTPNSGSGS